MTDQGVYATPTDLLSALLLSAEDRKKITTIYFALLAFLRGFLVRRRATDFEVVPCGDSVSEIKLFPYA